MRWRERERKSERKCSKPHISIGKMLIGNRLKVTEIKIDGTKLGTLQPQKVSVFRLV